VICTCHGLTLAPHPRLGRIVARVRDEKCLLHGTMLDGASAAVADALGPWTREVEDINADLAHEAARS